ncbi:MAG: membrane dipeptidase [Clostridia bacterium]|nr:membrane dipeptidase [Clostridia bacterium]
MKDIKLFDLHSDLPTAELPLGVKLEIAKKNSYGGYRVVNAIFRGKRSLKNCEKIAKDFTLKKLSVAFEDACFEDYILDGGKISVIKINQLCERLCNYYPTYISLGWNNTNIFCGGCAESGNLTEYGKVFVKGLNKKRCVVDCAHANKKSFYSLCEHADRVICSHTAFDWVYPHRRNIDKEQVKTILQKGGIIGLIGVGHFLSGVKDKLKNYEQALLLHIERYVEEFGVAGLAIGSDFYGSDAPVYTDGDYGFTQSLFEKLLSRGFTKEEINMILYKNAFEFFSI